jgi:peptide/nickel transport system substrate-binding protein
VSPERAVAEIKAGQIDYSLDGAPADQDRQLQARYGIDSPAGRAGRAQYFIYPGQFLEYYALNTSRPLFGDARLRQAVNYAIDREALLRRADRPSRPTDQYLQPQMPGYKELHAYPPVPDLLRAKRLAHGHHGTAILYTCNSIFCREQAAILAANLRAIGISVDVKTFPGYGFVNQAGIKGAPFDIVLDAWISDYFDPFDSLNALLDGKTIAAAGNNNVSYFNDPAYNRRLAAAAKLTGVARYNAYARLDADLTRDAAPWVPVGNSLTQAFFSARVGCQQFAPGAGSNVDLAALCIRGRAH